MDNSSHQSQCQLIQLHIDSVLDGELEAAREQLFYAHINTCSECRSEYEFARTLHHAVQSLPILDCSDHALEPVDRLFAAGTRQDDRPITAWWQRLRAGLAVMPQPLRYALPALAAVVLVIGFDLDDRLSGTGPGVAIQDSPRAMPTQQYTEADVQQALADLDEALDYLTTITLRTSTLVQDRVLLQQMDESIEASFRAAGNTPASGPF